MSVIFCGKSALWLWRSRAAIEPPLPKSRTREVLEHADSDREEVRSAVWKVNSKLNGRWCGSWRPEVLVRAESRRQKSYTRLHQAYEGVIVHPIAELKDVYVTSAADALSTAAEELDIESCALLGIELCGTYGIEVNMNSDLICRNEPRTSVAELRERLNRAGTGRRGIYAESLKYVADGAASPMEARLFLLFTLPRRRGGLGLPAPLMNPVIELPAATRRLCGCKTLRPDFLWPEQKVILEYDSTKHHFPENGETTPQTQSDRRRRNALESLGYRVWSMSGPDVGSYEGFSAFMDSVVQGLCLRRRKVEGPTATMMRDEYGRVLQTIDPLAGVYRMPKKV